MVRIIILIATIHTIALRLYAQEISLEYLLKEANNELVFQADRQVEIDEIKLKIQQNKRIPLVFGESNLQRNLIVPTTPVPAIVFNPNAGEGEIMPLRFATNWSAKAGLQLSFDLFDPELEGAIKEAKLVQLKSSIQQQETNRTSENNLRSLYAEVVLAQSQFDASKALLDDYVRTLAMLEQRKQAGRVGQVEWNNALQKSFDLEQLEQEAGLVLLNKKIAILPSLPTLDLNATFTTSLDEVLKSAQVSNSKVDSELNAVDMSLNQLKISNLNKLAIPKLSLNGYLGTQYFNNELRLLNGDNWFGTSYVNLALRVPITETFERNLTRKQLLLESSILESKNSINTSNDEVITLKRNNELLILRKKVTTQENIVALADENLKITKSQLEEGTILISVLNKELESYLDHMKRFWQAQYDLLQKMVE